MRSYTASRLLFSDANGITAMFIRGLHDVSND